jgi:hypothetical protein
MTIREIVELAREMMRTMRDGLRRACHYLQSLNLPAEFAAWALLGLERGDFVRRLGRI